MQFNELVKKKLFPLLDKQGFKIAEEYKNIIRFESAFVRIGLAFNELEKSTFIEIGKVGGLLYPLSEQTIKYFFNSDFPVEKVTTEEFVENIAHAFESKEGVSILKGNIDPLLIFFEKESANYTSKLIKSQLIKKASLAWQNKEYSAFIKLIDELYGTEVPPSVSLKYKIAIQKLSLLNDT